MAKLFEVKLKLGHPTGVYQRAGVTFTSRLVTTFVADVVTLTEDQVTDEMRNDPWLDVAEIAEGD